MISMIHKSYRMNVSIPVLLSAFYGTEEAKQRRGFYALGLMDNKKLFNVYEVKMCLLTY